jgi:hypothetical protein
MKNCRLSVLVKIAFFTMFCMLFITRPAMAQNVKITPLGSHDGEFCKFDRALILEERPSPG